MAIKIPKRALTPVIGDDDCVVGWAVNIVTVDLDALGYTLIEDKDSPIVPYVDADGCVKGWVVKVVAAEEEA